MSRRIIPVTDVSAIPDFAGIARTPHGLLTDRLLRELRELRISVTDHCNFRCVYCMPCAKSSIKTTHSCHTAPCCRSRKLSG